MSGSVAPRYQTGLLYDPSMGVGRYGRLPTVDRITGGTDAPVLTVPTRGQTDASGIAVRPEAGTVTPAAGGEGGGSDNLMMLTSLLLSMAPYLPQAYTAARDLFGAGDAAAAAPGETLPTPPEYLTPEQAFDASRASEAGLASDATVGPYNMPVVPFGGQSFGYVPPGASSWSAPDTSGVIWSPQTPSFGDTGAAVGGGWVHPGDLGATSVPAVGVSPQAIQSAAAAPGTAGASWYGLFGIPTVENPITGLGALGGVDIANALASAGAGAFGSYAGSTLARPGGEVGAGIGGAAGATIGGLIAAPFGLAPVGAALGGLIGSGGGGQIGPNPTVGRNYSSFGTFDPSGGIGWGTMGGDNGGTAADAQGMSDWFGNALAQEAAAHGYGFNPNMQGVQIRVGGYDNATRGTNGPSGFFYDVAGPGQGFGGSPENYALRATQNTPFFSGWDPSQVYGPEQARAFTSNVLADLVARGVYTPGGQAGPGMDYFGQTLGAGYGLYSPGTSFDAALADRRGVIGDWVNQQTNLLSLLAGQREAGNYADIRPDMRNAEDWSGYYAGIAQAGGDVSGG
ncbi:hypothetical protein GXW74_17155 [Roseomonas eburnea]|uniref:Uncharacterized protein n=1 Tax=Neoroseomonas eburnea TaxID=1346889 RepID=A0A9X9XET6_9PROT|nr:hypothetical protein [Neoroseomonas eburnea]MBR0682222.1 hypothetical protein [Neoroseomonas eburnea]